MTCTAFTIGNEFGIRQTEGGKYMSGHCDNYIVINNYNYRVYYSQTI